MTVLYILTDNILILKLSVRRKLIYPSILVVWPSHFFKFLYEIFTTHPLLIFATNRILILIHTTYPMLIHAPQSNFEIQVPHLLVFSPNKNLNWLCNRDYLEILMLKILLWLLHLFSFYVLRVFSSFSIIPGLINNLSILYFKQHARTQWSIP